MYRKVDLNLGHEQSACPIALMSGFVCRKSGFVCRKSGFVCRTSGYFEICTTIFFISLFHVMSRTSQLTSQNLIDVHEHVVN